MNAGVAVQDSAKFLELATEITLMKSKFRECPEKLPYYCALFKQSFAQNASNLRSNFRLKVRENKERNSRISLALLLHNTVEDKTNSLQRLQLRQEDSILAAPYEQT